MDALIKIAQLLLTLSLLVFVHELGHFCFARLFGMRVEKFFLFFYSGRPLWSVTYRGTEYGIGWIPFGGFVKIAGMVDESLDRETMGRPPRSDEFRSKPAWQRLLVMVGGVMMNMVLAFAIYVGMSWHYGDAYFANADMKWGNYFNELGHRIGFEDGDKIVAIDGEAVDDYSDIMINMLINQVDTVTVERGGRIVPVAVGSRWLGKVMETAEAGDFMLPRMPFSVARVEYGGRAAMAGIEPGDRLVALEGRRTEYFDEYVREFERRAGSRVEVTVERDSADATLLKTLEVAVSPEGRIGVEAVPITRYVPVHTRSYTLAEAFPAGLHRTGAELSSYWKQLKLLVKPSTGAYKSMGGVIAMGDIFPTSWNWRFFWSISAMLSVVLAVMNLLPIPGLDGGHVLFLLYEVVSGRKPSDRFMISAQIFGMVLLFMLFIVITMNDIYRVFIK